MEEFSREMFSRSVCSDGFVTNTYGKPVVKSSPMVLPGWNERSPVRCLDRFAKYFFKAVPVHKVGASENANIRLPLKGCVSDAIKGVQLMDKVAK